MASPDELKEAQASEGTVAPEQPPAPADGSAQTEVDPPAGDAGMTESGETAGEAPVTAGDPPAPEPSATPDQAYDDPYYGYGYDEGYPYDSSSAPASTAVAPVDPAPVPAPAAADSGSGGGSEPPKSGDEEEDSDDEGMLRMSFLEHLEELRSRLFKMLIGIGAAFLISLTFSDWLWNVVSAPAVDALTQLGVKPPTLSQITPMEVFNVVWVKLPILAAIFIASPWVLWQIWSFIAPGLYKRERKWAGPFVICSAGLFILGGMFAYFVAFRFGLVFLLGIGRDKNITPLVSVTEYFDLFVNVTLGVAIVFELPVLIFFLTLLRILSPSFLLRNVRYAILGIVLLAAVVTPTPDIFNLMLFSVPMIVLFFAGVFASYLLVLNREGKAFPWGKVLLGVTILAAAAAGAVYLAITRYGFHLIPSWPFLTK